MALISGIVLMALAVVAFFFSLPRAGKTAVFVGTQWEPYIVVGILCAFAAGMMLFSSTAIQLL